MIVVTPFIRRRPLFCGRVYGVIKRVYLSEIYGGGLSDTSSGIANTVVIRTRLCQAGVPRTNGHCDMKE